MTASLEKATVAIVGAGTMGSGIAQVAAQAGHPVLLYDVLPGAAIAAKEKLTATFDSLIEKGKFSRENATTTLALIEPVEKLESVAEVGVVIEAIAEDLPIKQELFQQLEGLVGRECVLATNTSSQIGRAHV
jgi:3-hydroxybutyryl-CoA dehydrogenase